MRNTMRSKGFILPSVMIISLTIVTIMVTLIMVGSSSYKGGQIDHFQKLADQAAEAGTAYATACLNLSSHLQTWGPALSRNNLTPNADCTGANTYPSNTYVYSDSTVRTYFVVGNLDYNESFSAQVSSIGYAESLKPDGTVLKTYTSLQKKVITWPTDIEGQMSASGTNRTCAIVNSQVYCWGYNRVGQLGNGMYEGPDPVDGVEVASSIDSIVPVKVRQDPGVLAGKVIVKIFVAQHHSCALSDDGLMYCWGYNNNGQLGTNSTTDSPVPVQVAGALAGKTITDIGGTHNTTCAIADAKIYCWGTNGYGITGRNTTSGNTLTPTLVTASNTASTLPTNYSATRIATSGSRARTMCAIADGKAYCWGQNNIGSVGNNATSSTGVLVPTKVTDSGVLSGKTVTDIALDGYNDASNSTNGLAHVCAIADGKAYCWGENNSGQLGRASGNTTDSTVPVAVVDTGVLSGKTIQQIAVGLRHSCARADNGVYCWGNGASGQVGDGFNTNRTVPVAVATDPGMLTSSNVISVSAGANRGCAIVTDGRTFCWGLNSNGQIGDGTTTNRNRPTESLFLRPKGNQYIF